MRISLAAGVVAATLLAAGAASAQETVNTGPYLGLGAGYSILEDNSFSGTGINSKGEYDNGFGGLLTFGYAFDRNWRGEIEGGYRTNDIKNNSPGTNDGSSNAFTAMLNVLYDIRTGTPFTPYLGVGAGWVHYKASGMTPAAGTRVNDSDDNFGYQGIAGVTYDLSQRTKLFLDYRYLRSADPTVQTTTGTSVDTKYHDHLVTVGLRFMLIPPEAPAPAPVAQPARAAAPEPAPQPAQVVRSFQVFFDFDKSDVRPDARPIIEEAAANARKGGVSRIVLTGHTDKAGSAAYNQRLSERRAAAVKAEFVRMGFNANDIQTIGKGKTDPLVPTADGVREPKNRRVEIVF